MSDRCVFKHIPRVVSVYGPINSDIIVYTSVCVSPERGGVVAGGPARDEAALGAGAALAHLVHAARRPHLAHAHLALLLEVVGRSGNTPALKFKFNTSEAAGINLVSGTQHGQPKNSARVINTVHLALTWL